jgi:AcrR family transcriptional regulator
VATQAERTAETRGKLLDATIRCLIERGYNGTSTTAVCEAAGVSRGAQLHHFPTKAQLLAAAIEHLFATRHREFRGSFVESHDLGEAFERLWQIYVGDTLYAWMELLVASRTDESLRSQLRAVDDRFFAEAQLTCAQLLGLEPDDARVAGLARLILSVFDGMALNHTLGGREQVRDRVLEQLRALLAATG